MFDADGRLRRLFRGAITESDLDGLLASFGDEGTSEAKLRLLAETHFTAGNFELAVQYYRRLADLEPTRRDQIGMAWERQRAADRAKLVEAWVAKGHAHEARDETDAARVSFERALEIDPRHRAAADALRKLNHE